MPALTQRQFRRPQGTWQPPLAKRSARHACRGHAPVQQAARSTQIPHTVSNNWVKYPETQSTNQAYLKLKSQSLASWAVSTKTLPPAFDSWPPANHQQTDQCLGRVPSRALTEPLLGIKLLACPNPVKTWQARFSKIAQMYIVTCLILRSSKGKVATAHFLTFKVQSSHLLRSFHWNRTCTEIFVKLCLLIVYIIGS